MVDKDSNPLAPNDRIVAQFGSKTKKGVYLGMWNCKGAARVQFDGEQWTTCETSSISKLEKEHQT